MTKKVVGVYDNQTELIDAIEEYKNNGYAVQDFSIIGDTTDFSTTLESRTGVTTEHIGNDSDREEKGFWQSLMDAFDGDQNLGGNSANITDRLVSLGLTDDAAREYEEDVRAGRIILLTEEAGSGYMAERTDNISGTAGLYNADGYGTEEKKMKLREEQLDISKDTVQTGEVEVHKEVVEEQQKINIPVSREEVYVERREVNGVDTDTDVLEDGETIRVPIMEEQVEVTKKPVVSEEIVIGKREVTDTEQVVENVKHEEAHLETDSDRVDADIDRDIDRGRYNDR